MKKLNLSRYEKYYVFYILFLAFLILAHSFLKIDLAFSPLYILGFLFIINLVLFISEIRVNNKKSIKEKFLFSLAYTFIVISITTPLNKLALLGIVLSIIYVIYALKNEEK